MKLTFFLAFTKIFTTCDCILETILTQTVFNFAPTVITSKGESLAQSALDNNMLHQKQADSLIITLSNNWLCFCNLVFEKYK